MTAEAIHTKPRRRRSAPKDRDEAIKLRLENWAAFARGWPQYVGCAGTWERPPPSTANDEDARIVENALLGLKNAKDLRLQNLWRACEARYIRRFEERAAADACSCPVREYWSRLERLRIWLDAKIGE